MISERPLNPGAENELLKGEVTRLQEELRVMAEKNQKLEEENEKDPLTGAYNFRGMTKMARVLLPRERKEGQKEGHSKAEQGHSIVVGMFDLDDFKKLNTEYGHLKANEVLKNAVDILRRFIRERDIVGRFGGEEFVVVFNDASAEDIKNRFFDKDTGQWEVNFTTLVEGQEIRSSFSGGITEVAPGESVKDFQTILGRANAAMLQSKENGKRQITHFADDEVETTA